MIYKVSSVIKSFYKHIDKKVNFLVLISKIRICFRMLTLSSINLLALQAFIAFYNSSGMLRLELHTSSQGKLNFVWSREYKLKISGCATCRCGSEEKVWVVVLHWAVLMSRASARRRSQTPVQDKPGRPLGTQPLLRGGACAPLGGARGGETGSGCSSAAPAPAASTRKRDRKSGSRRLFRGNGSRRSGGLSEDVQGREWICGSWLQPWSQNLKVRTGHASWSLCLNEGRD